MKLRPSRTRRRGRIEIIPMIDVMFFLLATFMLASLSMQNLHSLPVNLPQGHCRTDAGRPAADPDGHQGQDICWSTRPRPPWTGWLRFWLLSLAGDNQHGGGQRRQRRPQWGRGAGDAAMPDRRSRKIPIRRTPSMTVHRDRELRIRIPLVLFGTAAVTVGLLLAASRLPLHPAERPLSTPVEIEAGLVELPSLPTAATPTPAPSPVAPPKPEVTAPAAPQAAASARRTDTAGSSSAVH